MTEEYKALLKSKGIRCLKLPVISRGNGGDDPNVPKVTVLFGQAYFEPKADSFKFKETPVYVKIEGYDPTDKTIYLFMGDSKYEEVVEAYEETQPGDEVPYDYLELGVDLEPNEDPDYGEYQYKASLPGFYYNANGYCIALGESSEDEHCYVVAKTQSTVPANTLELISVTDGDSTIVAQYNRPLETTNMDMDAEFVCSCTTAREVGADVTDDPNVVNIVDRQPYGNGVEIPKASFEPGDLYIITTVRTWSDETNDIVYIVTTCSEKIVIPLPDVN